VHGGARNDLAIVSTIDLRVQAGRMRFDGLRIGAMADETALLASATAPAVQAVLQP
jgi:hypothetical protein